MQSLLTKSLGHSSIWRTIPAKIHLNSSFKFLLEFYSRILDCTLFLQISHHWKTFLAFYFLNSTLLFDLARRIFSTLFIKLHLPSHISNSTLKIFNATSEFSFTLQWSLIKTICRVVGRGWLFSPSCFAPFVETWRQRSHLLLNNKTLERLDSYQDGDYSGILIRLEYLNCIIINGGDLPILSWVA